jgi:hypothetical protein
VVRPGGVLLVDLGGLGIDQARGWWREARTVFADAAGIDRHPEGPEIRGRVEAALRARGASVRPLPAIVEQTRVSSEASIARLERGLYSFTWDATEDQRRRGADAVRAWLRGKDDSLTERTDVTRTIRWLAYDLPG